MILAAYAAAMVVTVAAQAFPGPNLMAVASTSLARGRRAGVAVAAGVAAGTGLWCAGMAFGLGALLVLYPALLTAVSLLGGAYLLWLCARGLRTAWQDGTRFAPDATSSVRDGDFHHGLAIVATNPKAALLWAAVAALLFGRGLETGTVLAFAPLGAASAFLIYGSYALLFSTGAATRAYARFARPVETAFALVFGAMGAGLILLGLRSARG